MEENEKMKVNSENVENKTEKVKGKNKNITVVLTVVILILVLGIGVCAGILLAKGDTNIFNITEQKEQQTEQANKQNYNENNEVQNDNTTQNDSTNKTITYEKDNLMFNASAKWEYKIEEINDDKLKINSEDKLYQISGKVNGKYETAFSVVITNNKDSYMESSWEYLESYDSKHIFTMRNFVCRDNDGNEYTSEHYEFEKDVINTYKSLNVNFETDSTSKTITYEKDNFMFNALSKWEYKIEEKNDETYKINSNDQYYEISGKVNGNYVKAFSIVITNNQNSYMNSSWEYYGLYNGGKHIFVMRNFICRDNDGNTYTSEHYEFEKDVIEAMSSINVKYQVLNEWGSADTTTVLVGKYFLKGEPGTSKRAYIYYISENNLYRTTLKDEFPTVLLANYAKYMYYSEGDNKIHVHPVGNSFMNNIAMEDNFVVYESIDVTYKNPSEVISGGYIRSDEKAEISGGTLGITNVKDDSFDFSISAYTVTNIEKIDEGAVNTGEFKGTAIKVEDGKYECIDKDAYENFGTEYKLIFTLKDNKTFEVTEVFDKSNVSSPYCGYNVTLNGTYVFAM